MIFTPFVLWFSLPKCSDQLIDFFREFTIHVDGMGYLCSFAVFDFKRGTNTMSQNRPEPARQDQDLRADYFSTKDNKMLTSYFGFLEQYGNNQPPAGRRTFHAPPNLPTLGSPSAIEIGANPERFNHHNRSGQPGGHFGPQSIAGASRFRSTPLGDQRSPAPSVLLDPHHQPSKSGLRAGQRAYDPHLPSRLAQSSYPINDPINGEEEPPSRDTRDSGTRPLAAAGASSGGVGTGESSLGDSWRMNPIGKDVGVDDEDEEEGENVDDIAGGAGVLGLIQQFQKANTDGRRTTVGI